MQKFKEYSRKDKIKVLFSCFNLAIYEDKQTNRTDIYGIAAQYRSDLKKSDFDLIKNMTIDEIVEELK